MSTHTASFTHTAQDRWSLDSDVMNLEFEDMQACRRAFPRSRLFFRPRNGDRLELVEVTQLSDGKQRWAFRRTARTAFHPEPGLEYRVMY